MTEVIPETPMKIQEEEIMVEDGFEHHIKILDISEQNVNIMKEWMAFQRFFEDIPETLGSLYRDPDGRMDKYEPYINTHKGKTNLSPLTCGVQPFPALSLGKGITKCLHQWLPGST